MFITLSFVLTLEYRCLNLIFCSAVYLVVKECRRGMLSVGRGQTSSLMKGALLLQNQMKAEYVIGESAAHGGFSLAGAQFVKLKVLLIYVWLVQHHFSVLSAPKLVDLVFKLVRYSVLSHVVVILACSAWVPKNHLQAKDVSYQLVHWMLYRHTYPQQVHV